MTEKEKKPIELEDLLSKLKMTLLLQLCEGNSIKGIAHSHAKKKVISAIVDHAVQKGEKEFLASLEKEDIRAALLALGKTIDHDSKTRMHKELKEEIDGLDNLADFFAKFKDRKILEIFCGAVGFELGSDASNSEIEDALNEEILISGCKILFESMTKDYVTDVAKELKLKFNLSKKTVST